MNTTAEVAKQLEKRADRESRATLSWEEARMLRTMATGGQRRAAARVGESEVMVGDQAFGSNMSVTLDRVASADIGYVRDNKDTTYTLLDAGERAAFAPRFTRRTWLRIAVLASLIAIAIVGARHLYWFGLSEHAVRPPVGSIIAWHKHPAATENDRGPALKLPDGWMECNGDPLPPDSPLRVGDAERIPDLNGEGRFLRGGTKSGTRQKATAFPRSRNRIVAGEPQVEEADNTFDSENVKYSYEIKQAEKASSDTAVEFARVRPMNMSVVWIIRVK